MHDAADTLQNGRARPHRRRWVRVVLIALVGLLLAYPLALAFAHGRDAHYDGVADPESDGPAGLFGHLPDLNFERSSPEVEFSCFYHCRSVEYSLKVSSQCRKRQ